MFWHAFELNIPLYRNLRTGYESSDSYMCVHSIICYVHTCDPYIMRIAYSTVYESEDLAESPVSYTIHVHIQKACEIVYLGVWRPDWHRRFIIRRGTSQSLNVCVPISTPSPQIRTQRVWFLCVCTQMYMLFSCIVQGVLKKTGQSFLNAILQSYVTESCSYQQNVQKEIVYMIKASMWIQPLNILCFPAGKWTIWKQN